MSDDYKQGYKDGFKDGIAFARVEPADHKKLNPWEGARAQTTTNVCILCGISFTDALGNPIAFGYVCNNPQCPTTGRRPELQRLT